MRIGGSALALGGCLAIAACGGGSGTGAGAPVPQAHVVKVPSVGSNGWAYGALKDSAPVITVSCPTTSFCMAVDNSYHAYTFNGSAWAGPYFIDQAASKSESTTGAAPSYVSVSCATPQFCAAVDGSRLYTFNGTSWSTPTPLSQYGGLSISCPAAGSCLAMDNNGYAYTYSGGAWTTHKGVAPEAENGQDNAVYQVSCASASFCAIVSATGAAQAYNGTTWTNPVPIDAGAKGMVVACQSTAFCMALDTAGGSYTFDGTSWKHNSYENGNGNDGGGVSCASASSCMTLDDQSHLFRFNGSAWNLDEYFMFTGASDSTLAAGVSCPSDHLCVVVGEGHYAIWR
jgi:hypothetical protein